MQSDQCLLKGSRARMNKKEVRDMSIAAALDGNIPTTVTIDGRSVRMLGEETEPIEMTAERHVFIVGSKGIPANYGGFETFVEKLTQNQRDRRILYHVARIDTKNREFRYEYNGAYCFNVKVPDVGPAKAVMYDLAALDHCIEYCKQRPYIVEPIFYVLACRIGPFIQQYKRQIHKLGGKLFVNPDGHEWKRAKWNRAIRQYWKVSERLMVKHADLLICDSVNIEKYIKEDYKVYKPHTTFLAYGSDLHPSPLTDQSLKFQTWLKEKGFESNKYYLVVGRFVPENNYETIIREFMKSKTKNKLCIITTENPSFYEDLENKLHFSRDKRIVFAGTVYDDELLKKIRECSCGYIHGHEVGGTNPSLLEALSCTKLNLLLGVGFNREVGEDTCLYWSKKEGSLKELIELADSLTPHQVETFGEKAKERIRTAYSWRSITDRYEEIFMKRDC